MKKPANQNVLKIILGTGGLLLIPLVGMQFSTEVNWTVFDFIVAGALLLTTGLSYEFISRKLKNKQDKKLLGFVLLITLALIWIELAVGIFD